MNSVQSNGHKLNISNPNVPKLGDPTVISPNPSGGSPQPEYYDIYSQTVLTGSSSVANNQPIKESGMILPTIKPNEGFTPIFSGDIATPTTMSANIASNKLSTNWMGMTRDAKFDLSNNVVDPYGYGYIASLDETRNKDTLDLYQQENFTFIIGAITGVSLIVLGILMASNQSIASE